MRHQPLGSKFFHRRAFSFLSITLELHCTCIFLLVKFMRFHCCPLQSSVGSSPTGCSPRTCQMSFPCRGRTSFISSEASSSWSLQYQSCISGTESHSCKPRWTDSGVKTLFMKMYESQMMNVF